MIIAAKSVYFLSTPPQKCLFPVQFSIDIGLFVIQRGRPVQVHVCHTVLLILHTYI
jgi:hypothetical protein